MCIAITTRGKVCKLAPKDRYCKLHKRFKDSEYRTTEVKNLNKTMNKKNNVINSLKSELIDNRNLMMELNFSLDEKINEITNLKHEVEAMKQDFENYQFIKMFETIKMKLKKERMYFKDVQLLNWYLDAEENKRKMEDIFKHSNKNKLIPFSTHFDMLRLKRNKLSHTYN